MGLETGFSLLFLRQSFCKIKPISQRWQNRNMGPDDTAEQMNVHRSQEEP